MHAVHACCICTACVCAVHTILDVLARNRILDVLARNRICTSRHFTKYMIKNSELQLPTKVEVQTLTFVLIDS